MFAQCLLRTACRAALSRAVCQTAHRGGRAVPPRDPLRRCLSQPTGRWKAAGSGLQGRHSSWAGTFRHTQHSRPGFRTFSSGGSGAGGGRGGSGGGGGGGDGSGGGLWQAYLSLLERRPVVTKALTAAFLNGLGDVIAQLQFEKGNAFDWRRLGVFTFLGLVLIGPALHVWYGFLGRIVTAGGNAGAAARMALDQLCFAPLFISVIVASIMALEGKAAAVPSRLRRDLPDMVRSNWLLWVPFQFVNFRFVPPQLQVLMANLVALIWNTYMSWKSHA